MAKVSVIIPVYNAERYLRECLDSVVNQSLDDIEIICIDDNSNDNSPNILQEYKEKYDITILKNNDNIGAALSRNKGINVASGKYIIFLDSDDFIEKQALQILYDEVEKLELDMCFYKLNVIGEVKNEPKGILGTYDEKQSGRELLKKFIENNEFFMYLCSVFYNREFLVENKLLFDSVCVGEGGDFILRALIHAENVNVCNKCLYNYRIHEESITHSNSSRLDLLAGQVRQYLSLLKESFLYNYDEIDIAMTYIYKKMIGGLSKLSVSEQKTIFRVAKNNYENNIINLLLRIDDRYFVDWTEEKRKKAIVAKNVFVYGAGHASETVIRLLSDEGISIKGFVVSRIEDCSNQILFGHRIYSIDQVPEMDDSYFLVSANKVYNNEIEETFMKYNIKNYDFLNVKI